MKRSINIQGRPIGSGYPTYVIAEISANHNQSFEQAAELIKVAKGAGADAVKLQTYTPDTLTIDSRSEYFQIKKGSLWEGRNLHDLYAEAYTPWDWQPRLKVIADELGIALFSSPFDATAVEFLESMNVPAYKIASFEIVDLALIEKVAQTGKPLILSTGMANLAEIEEAVRTARKAGATEIVLLKCTSAYPSLPNEMNLRTIAHLSQAFDLPVGLSDHTMGFTVPVAAVALGACVVEKHITLSRDTPGPDSAFSLEPQELKALVEAVRVAEEALGEVRYEVTDREEASKVFRRSLFVVRDVKAGQIFTAENVRSIRPAHGLAPRYLNIVLGRQAARDVAAGTPVSWDIIGDGRM